MPVEPSLPSRSSPAPSRRGEPPLAPSPVPPLLPVLLPVVIAAIVIGGLFAWWFPPVPPGTNAPAPRFTDVTEEAGLAGLPAGELSEETPTTLGGGVVCFDYDNDGHEDLFFVNGGPWPWEEPLAKRISRGSCWLMHNDGTGRFTDATARAGMNVELQGMSAAAGDFDNDGLTDLYVTCVGPNHLFRNRGQGRFEDVTDLAGVGGEDNTWSTGATWIDYDGDGRLDLVVGHYARWPWDVDLRTAFTVSRIGHSYGAPTGFVGVFPTVYRNLGEGRFAIVADNAGLRDADPETRFPVAKTLAVVPVDANNDGKLDLLFTYHTAGPALFVNQADGSFRRWTVAPARRQEGAAAGFASASSLPFAQTSGADERLGPLQAAMAAGSGRGDLPYVRLSGKLGVAVLDYDLDGRMDFIAGNGRAERDTGQFGLEDEFRAEPAFWWNRGGEWVAAVASKEQAELAPMLARGVASADFDGDGDSDVVIAQHGQPPRLWRNDQRFSLPSLQIQLTATKGLRDADGARVEVHTPRRVFVRTVAPAMSYMAQSSRVLTFGLGDDARVRKVVVQWPSGTRQEVRPASGNRRLSLTEP